MATLILETLATSVPKMECRDAVIKLVRPTVMGTERVTMSSSTA